jgi:hypothetical protein
MIVSHSIPPFRLPIGGDSNPRWPASVQSRASRDVPMRKRRPQVGGQGCEQSGEAMNQTTKGNIRKAARVSGQCVCGRMRLEFDYPAFWAWHDHSRSTQHAHGAAYATYVGVWKGRFRIILGSDCIVRFKDKARRTTRSFCATCGTPVLYERSRSPNIVSGVWRAVGRARSSIRRGNKVREASGVVMRPIGRRRFWPQVGKRDILGGMPRPARKRWIMSSRY